MWTPCCALVLVLSMAVVQAQRVAPQPNLWTTGFAGGAARPYTVVTQVQENLTALGNANGVVSAMREVPSDPAQFGYTAASGINVFYDFGRVAPNQTAVIFLAAGPAVDTIIAATAASLVQLNLVAGQLQGTTFFQHNSAPIVAVTNVSPARILIVSLDRITLVTRALDEVQVNEMTTRLSSGARAACGPAPAQYGAGGSLCWVVDVDGTVAAIDGLTGVLVGKTTIPHAAGSSTTTVQGLPVNASVTVSSNGAAVISGPSFAAKMGATASGIQTLWHWSPVNPSSNAVVRVATSESGSIVIAALCAADINGTSTLVSLDAADGSAIGAPALVQQAALITDLAVDDSVATAPHVVAVVAWVSFPLVVETFGFTLSPGPSPRFLDAASTWNTLNQSTPHWAGIARLPLVSPRPLCVFCAVDTHHAYRPQTLCVYATLDGVAQRQVLLTGRDSYVAAYYTANGGDRLMGLAAVTADDGYKTFTGVDLTFAPTIAPFSIGPDVVVACDVDASNGALYCMLNSTRVIGIMPNGTQYTLAALYSGPLSMIKSLLSPRVQFVAPHTVVVQGIIVPLLPPGTDGGDSIFAIAVDTQTGSATAYEAPPTTPHTPRAAHRTDLKQPPASTSPPASIYYVDPQHNRVYAVYGTTLYVFTADTASVLLTAILPVNMGFGKGTIREINGDFALLLSNDEGALSVNLVTGGVAAVFKGRTVDAALNATAGDGSVVICTSNGSVVGVGGASGSVTINAAALNVGCVAPVFVTGGYAYIVSQNTWAYQNSAMLYVARVDFRNASNTPAVSLWYNMDPTTFALPIQVHVNHEQQVAVFSQVGYYTFTACIDLIRGTPLWTSATNDAVAGRIAPQYFEQFDASLGLHNTVVLTPSPLYDNPHGLVMLSLFTGEDVASVRGITIADLRAYRSVGADGACGQVSLVAVTPTAAVRFERLCAARIAPPSDWRSPTSQPFAPTPSNLLPINAATPVPTPFVAPPAPGGSRPPTGAIIGAAVGCVGAAVVVVVLISRFVSRRKTAVDVEYGAIA